MSRAECARRRRFRMFMDGYYSARHAWLVWCEQETAMYAAEVAEFIAAHPPMVFKRWLIESRGIPR